MSVEPPRELVVLAIWQRRSRARLRLYNFNDFYFLTIKGKGLYQASCQEATYSDLPSHQGETVLGIG